ncbi:MAG: Fe-S protein assembly co-chaperone HscB [Burkholderiales bacterium]|nr:Fe-S protein assembly co-chaperone HscB [Burkholderiales bacterium]MDE1929304.1 Fe-S protein assembly co-chaperone HscB [Burkholderiales bacterium]MDE2157373.1 Fe-S protein assembly co-chaperone HscB [Burkholderiales bacterium]MDE2504774.1 Fe-S protein assembly co-chaperone HscB [Burkholderiales bacterium]
MKISDDDYTLFGLAPTQALVREDLDARRRDLQSRVHPDRFAAEGDAAQRLAMQWAVRVNQAYQRLKDPLARAAYLCELRGVPVDAERNTAMPTEFLMQQMQWREALDEAGDDLVAVERLDAAVAADERAMFDRLTELLDRRGDTVAAAAQVRALMFLARFRHDIERRLDALDAQR